MAKGSVKLLFVYPNRWGPGKVHLLRSLPYTACGRAPYGKSGRGTMKDVTCKKCLSGNG